MNSLKNELDGILGTRVTRATSSLSAFALRLDNGRALLVEASGDAVAPYLGISTPSQSNLPEEKDAVCAVDWEWIYGSKISSVKLSEGALRLELEPAGPLTVAVHVWQGKPFLSFQPFKAPGK